MEEKELRELFNQVTQVEFEAVYAEQHSIMMEELNKMYPTLKEQKEKGELPESTLHMFELSLEIISKVKDMRTYESLTLLLNGLVENIRGAIIGNPERFIGDSDTAN